MTARETLRFVARFFSVDPIEARVAEMLALVGLEDKADRPVGHFSGGERQRLGLAQAQINAPELLILDEPAAALDPIGRHDVLELMSQLRQRATIFYSTHILDDVQQVSDTVAILNQGALVAQGPIEHLLAGSGNVIFEVQTKGDGQVARDHLSGQAWVADVKTLSQDGQTLWQVAVVDEQQAEAQLLPLLVNDEHLTVTAFNRKTYELEEIFMNVIQGETREQE
jgi:ABC-2 type transport system ATP-binding protein